MKKNKRILMITIALILALSLSFSAVASARNTDKASSSSSKDDAILRGVAWEELNSLVIEGEGLFMPGSYYTDQYSNALRNYCAYAKNLLDDPHSSTDALNTMCFDMRTIIGDCNHPLNHSVYNCYTVAFTNNGSWSDPIYLYNWSDDGGEVAAWPGVEMTGGYKNEFGQKQYYATVPKDVPNIVISSNSLAADGQYNAVPAVRVQTEDIFVTGNTGYYLTGEKDGAKYKVATWELKAPEYKKFDLTEPIPTEPVTEQPTVAPTVKPTEAPTEKPTVKADPVTEPATEFNIDNYLPKADAMLEFYEHSSETPAQADLRQMIVDATYMLAPGNNFTPEYIEKVSRVRNFAVKVYNDSRSADNELVGARHMLQAAFENKSYEEIVGVMYQWFNMPDNETADPVGVHLIGDADGDGKITIYDATRIQRVLVGYDEDKRQMAETYAAVSGNELSVLDATAIQRYIAGYEDHYGIGSYILPTGLQQSPTDPTTVSHIVYR